VLLRNGNMSVAQVATESGFAEVRTFNRLFKAHHGISPTDYRKQ
jgi:AraC-like DNA-binding protein